MDHGCEARVRFVAPHSQSFELLEFTEEILDKMPPLVDVEFNGKRRFAVRHLRDDDLCSTFVQLAMIQLASNALSAIRPPNATPLISGAMPIVS
jgi:hypothetical protein